MIRAALVIAALLAPLAAAATSAPRAPAPALSPPPAGLVAGERWDATLTLPSRPATPPRLQARLGARRVSFNSSGSTRPGVYRFRVVLPVPGRWRVAALGRGLRTVAVAPRVAATPVAGATALRICGGTGEPYPQYALAADGARLWVACNDAKLLVETDRSTGAVLHRVGLGLIHPWAIAALGGAVWVADRRLAVLSRVNPASGRVVKQISLPDLPVYAWALGGAIWVGLSGGTQLVQVDPARGVVSALVEVGDGASGMATDGQSLWVVCHRENSLFRIDPRTHRATKVGLVIGEGNAALDRIAYAFGSLWITGRGLDLLRVDPATGRRLATIEVGAAGIDVAATDSGVVVPAYTAAAEPTGFPFVEAVRVVAPATNTVTRSLRAKGRMVLNGVWGDAGAAWLADTAAGKLVRISAR